MRPEYVATRGGYLEIYTDDTKYRGAQFSSGQVQSWNKFCFTGGRIDVAITLPGKPATPGLWPAVWLMGNLGRATFDVHLAGRGAKGGLA